MGPVDQLELDQIVWILHILGWTLASEMLEQHYWQLCEDAAHNDPEAIAIISKVRSITIALRMLHLASSEISSLFSKRGESE
jgi:hypothetical protein